MAEALIEDITAPTQLHALAPAKVNLSLVVHGKRPDGFHALTSLVVAVELFDELSFALADTEGVKLISDDASLPPGSDNLVVRAAEALASRCGTGILGARIELRKRIPVAAGLGGGSSDAAMTLLALNRLWQNGLSGRELAALAAELGSDVPLFLALPSAVIRSRGDEVTPTRMQWSGWVVLVFGEWRVSTRETYANWRQTDRESGSVEPAALIAAARSAAQITPLLVNELEAAVYRTIPQVRSYHKSLNERTGLTWRLSGAGATAFALFDEERMARRVAEAVCSARLGRGVAVARTVTGSMDDYLRSDDRWRFPKPESN